MIKTPSEEFFNKCLDEAEVRYKGHFVRIDKQAFIIGCGYGYGAASVDWRQEIEMCRAAVITAQRLLCRDRDAEDNVKPTLDVLQKFLDETSLSFQAQKESK